ncbi:MAG: carboxymuconolactone decarboxylase family protein [Acetobacteraceae bacterium]
MTARLNAMRIAPEGLQALRGLQAYVNKSGLEPALLELVKIRASQINGCAYCLVMHHRDARANGERVERLDLLPAWEETPVYSARERAALAWTEAVTLVADGHVPDPVYDAARQEFSDKELVDLTYAVLAINNWNRINVAFRTPPDLPARNA